MINSVNDNLGMEQGGGSNADRAPAPVVRESGSRSELLRNSHIFSSVVRDILEEKFLREITPNTLTLSQFRLLKAIVLNGRHQAGELAEFLGVTPPAATKTIDKLEGLGLLVRGSTEKDRRVTLLSPSGRGRRLVKDYEELKTSRLEPVLEGFTGGEIEQFTRLLERFSLTLLEREESGGDLCLMCAAYCEEGCPVGKIRGGCPYERLRGASSAGGGSR